MFRFSVSQIKCWFCTENRGEDAAPGGWIYEDEYWRAGHVPHTYGPPGTVVLESRRHFLDFAEMNDAEARTFAGVAGQLIRAVKEVTGAERVYTWASMAKFPHLHVWLLPWTPAMPDGPEFLARIGSFAGSPENALQTAKKLDEAMPLLAAHGDHVS